MSDRQMTFADWLGNHDEGAKPQEDNRKDAD